MNRITAGYAGYVNPYGGQEYRVELRPENVLCFAFWSKNYAPFMAHLRTITELGYRSYFNFTITGLPRAFECNVVEATESVDTLKRLADLFTPRQINWRYDPIILSDQTPFNWHVDRFAFLAARLRGATPRCYFSFAVEYGKVRRSFEDFQRRNSIRIDNPDLSTRQRLANALAGIAGENGMTMHSCCNDLLVGGRILKAHCVDGDLIRDLFDPGGPPYKSSPTRKECGCAESTDIGAYDTCPHGCIYCYANVNKARALEQFRLHDAETVFLGRSKPVAEEWEAAL